MFQKTVDHPEEYAPGYHVVLDDGLVVTVRVEQVESAGLWCPKTKPDKIEEAATEAALQTLPQCWITAGMDIT